MKLSLRTNITIPAWVAGVAAAVSVGCGVLALQLSRVLFTVIRESDYEAARMVTGVATAVQSDSTEILIPDEMYLEDEAKDVYSYGALQTILFRRTPAGVTDWQWSFNGVAWYNTDDTQADHATLLDPPNLIFICRLQLQSVARRKSASLKAKLLGQPNSHLGGRHIPPPLDTDDTSRDVFEAPDTLCCPISSCVMTQPVVAPSGKSFDYAALCEWVVRHGTDPTTNQALSLHDLYPNLVLREQVERWLAGEDLGFSPAAAAAAAAAAGAGAAAATAAAAATGGAGADTAADAGAGVGTAAADGAGGMDAAAAGGAGAAMDAAAVPDQSRTADTSGVVEPSAAAAAAGAAGACGAAGAQEAVAAADMAAGEPVFAERTADTEAATSSSQAMTHDSSRSETLERLGQEQERQQGGATSSSSSSVVEAAGGAGSGHQHQQAASSSSSSGSVGVSGGGVAVMPRPLGVSLEAPAGDGVAATTAAASSSQLASSSGGVNNTSMAELIPLGSTGGRRDVETPSPAGLAAVLQPLRHHLPAVSSSGSGAGVPSSSGSGILGQASSSSSSAGQLCSVRSSSSATSSSREWQRGPGLDSSSGCGGALLSVAQAPGVSAGAGYGPRHVQPALAGGLPVGLPTPAMLQATRLVQL